MWRLIRPHLASLGGQGARPNSVLPAQRLDQPHALLGEQRLQLPAVLRRPAHQRLVALADVQAPALPGDAAREYESGMPLARRGEPQI